MSGLSVHSFHCFFVSGLSVHSFHCLCLVCLFIPFIVCLCLVCLVIPLIVCVRSVCSFLPLFVSGLSVHSFHCLCLICLSVAWKKGFNLNWKCAHISYSDQSKHSFQLFVCIYFVSESFQLCFCCCCCCCWVFRFCLFVYFGSFLVCIVFLKVKVWRTTQCSRNTYHRYKYVHVIKIQTEWVLKPSWLLTLQQNYKFI